MRARLGGAFLAKGVTIACETRLDSRSHNGSECYRIIRLAHWMVPDSSVGEKYLWGPSDDDAEKDGKIFRYLWI